MNILNVVGNVISGFANDDQIGRYRFERFRVLNCSSVAPALKDWMSAMASRMSSIRRCQFF
jgi:hypothetical protein